ncbi:uncharacterized protein LOC129908474 isoform X2 [Episyrphus balteatus]|uniref:uncharacterized protein LOC129908474 isoform X2 n=1 Tax=Episyrphus balteatus TaxID=286459 RepID=UPI002485E278|nr:uncharacterized protein LOC129908474 isoform X2 [Episyrphus balteatus]
MQSPRLFPTQIPERDLAVEIPKAIKIIDLLPPEKYNKNLVRDLAVGYKSLVYAMEKDKNSQDVFLLFIKWCKLYMRLQQQIDSNHPIRAQFESRVAVCTSYIIASLQYQNHITNYHQNILEMCLSICSSAQAKTMQNLASLDTDLIALIWMPVEFVGDYITQRLCLKLIIAVLKHLSVGEGQTKIFQAKLDENRKKLILKLTTNLVKFDQVSRDVLNKYNMSITSSCAVFSIYCTKAFFGTSELFKPNKVSKFWMDFNCTSKSVSLLCQLNQSEGKQEEFYIKIRINKLQIENQFDCSVYTIGPAFFSTNVSAQLQSSRVAVFTLPENELERLKKNQDLFDYYNNLSIQESSDVSTPNTIIKYLAELSQDSPMTPFSENYNDTPKMKLAVAKDSPITPISENYNETPKMKSAVVKLYKFDAARKDLQVRDALKNQYKNLSSDNSATANRTTLVSHVEYLPNYEGPSIQKSGQNISTNSTAIEDASIFKKPTTPIKYKTKTKPKSKLGPLQELHGTYLSDKSTVLEDLQNLSKALINEHRKKNSDLPQVSQRNEIDEKDVFPGQTFKPRNEVESDSKSYSKLTAGQISIKEVSNVSEVATQLPNEETSISNNTLLELHSIPPETSEIPTASTPIQVTVNPIQKSPEINNSTETSQCIEISNNKSTTPKKSSTEETQRFSNDSYVNESSVLNQNTSQNQGDENHVTSTSQTSNKQSKKFFQNITLPRIQTKQKRTPKIVKNKKSYNNFHESLNSNPEAKNNLNDVDSQLPQDTSRRIFKNKNMPTIYSKTAIKAKKKTSKKKTNTAENHPKKRSVNFVRPLNFANDLSLNKIEPVSEYGKNENSGKMKDIVENKKKVGVLNQRKDLIIISDSEQECKPKPIRGKPNKRKAHENEVEISEHVPYSIWKVSQKDKNNGESIMSSPRPENHNEKRSKPAPPQVSRVKHFEIQNESIIRNPNIPLNSRCNNSVSDSSPITVFCKSKNRMQIAQNPRSVRNKNADSADSIVVSSRLEDQNEKRFEIEPPHIQNESIQRNQNNVPSRSRRSSSASESIYTSYSSKSKHKIQSVQNQLSVGNKDTNSGDSRVVSSRPEHQNEETLETEPPDIQNESISRNQNNVPARRRRSSSISESVHTRFFSKSKNEMQSEPDPLTVNKDTYNDDSRVLSPPPENQKEKRSETQSTQIYLDPFDKVKHFGIQNESFVRNNNNVLSIRRRRNSSSSDSSHTYVFSESEDEIQCTQDQLLVRNKHKVPMNAEIVRRDHPDDMISSPIAVPMEIIQTFTKSPSRDTILTSVQMSLVSDSPDILESEQQQYDSHQLLQNTTINIGSPIYEDLDDEDPSVTNQRPNVYNPLIETCHKKASGETNHFSDLEEENQEVVPIISNIQTSLHTHQLEIFPENITNEDQLVPRKVQFVKNVLQKPTDDQPTSSHGSPISIYSESEINKNDTYSNQVIIRNHFVTSLRKRTHCPDDEQLIRAKIPASINCTPLRDYDQLLPQFVKKLTDEKDRLINNIETKTDESVNFTKTLDVITKAIAYHQTAIKEEQTKLVSIIENLDVHQNILQKNQSELEKMYCQITESLRTTDQEAENKVDEMYREAEDVLKSYGDVLKKEQWHNFSKSIINSVNARLTGYLDI